jgi:hypothetical protein
MEEDFLIREANLKDIDFLVEVVVNAEKAHPACITLLRFIQHFRS